MSTSRPSGQPRPGVDGHIYGIPPIDSWDYLPCVPINDDRDNPLYSIGINLPLLCDEALQAFIARGFVDVRDNEPPRLLPLPSASSPYLVYGIIIKEDNNGTCWVWSPFALPWLEEYES